MTPKRGEGAAKGQIHEGNIELSVWSCWTAKLLLRAKVDAAKIDPKGKFISIDIDDDETAKPLFNTASSPSALIGAVERLEREISECEDLEKDYTNRSTKELDDAWITADEVKHRIGGLKFALNLLRSPPTEEVA